MEEKTSSAPSKQDLRLRDLFEKYISYWYWILIGLVLSIALAYLYIQFSQDEYQSTAAILIADESHGEQLNAMSVANQFNPLGNSSSTSSMINDEEMVIHSKDLMEKVVYTLQLTTSYYQYDRLHKTDIYLESPLVVTLDSTSLSHLHGTLFVQIIPISKEAWKIIAKHNDNQWEWETHTFPVQFQTSIGALIFSQRPNASSLSKPLYVEIKNPTSVASSLANVALTTLIMPSTNIINLTLTMDNPQKSQDILRTLIQLYNQASIERNNKAAINTANFIDNRLNLISNELSSVERDVERYKQANKLTDISSEAKLYLSNTNQYQQQAVAVQTQLHLIDYVEEFLKDPKNNNALVPNLGLTDVGLIAIINGYNELVLQRERIGRNSSSENPILNSLNHQVESARSAILTSIANARKGLLITNKELTAQDALMASKIREVPRQEREVLDIQRQQQVKQALYLYLLQKREETSLTMAAKGPKARIIDKANLGRKIAPNEMLIYAIFAFIGFVIPLIIIYFHHLFDVKIHSVKDLEQLTDIPVLTALSHLSEKNILFDHFSTTEINAELFRLLRTKLQFVLDSPLQKVVGVTSTTAAEGKTFVSINLAISLALTEKKVLLIGLDVRKPQLSKLFKIPSDQLGITNYLTNSDVDVNDLIYSVPSLQQLDLIVSGPIPPNPNELMLRHRLDEIIETLKDRYDFIILDTAPVGAVSDTLLLHRLIDVMLYVCRAEYTDKRSIVFVNQLHKEGVLNPLYFVLNDVHFEKRNYAYRYGYHYGYGNYKHPHSEST